MDERALWADLDEVDPHALTEYPPTVAWETSPGRYQALWLLSQGDLQGASWPGNENQRMTYLIGADLGGWDTTQLLRIPEWANHKPAYVRAHNGPAPGRLLWADGRTYLPDELRDLPEVTSAADIMDVALDDVEKVDREKVIARVRLNLPKSTREKMMARVASGDRSDMLWQIERDLADAGCSAVEIVAIVRETVWNKYAGRADELHRLFTESAKAIANRPPDVEERIREQRDQRPKPTLLGDLLRNIPNPEWLIEGIWTVGSCGFIAGQPKSLKSWMALDMGISVASGSPFLNHFKVHRQGAVLYIQEEDPAPMIRSRTNKIWPGKLQDRMVLGPAGVEWQPATDMTQVFADAKLPIAAMIRTGFIISDEAWQVWLDEVLTEGVADPAGGDARPYVLLILDTLMMTAGDVEENRSQEMTNRVFRPLKQMADKHGISICFVHHMRKGGDPRNPQRGGQMMLGSVANHAWAEDSLYVSIARGGLLNVETESKTAPSSSFRIGNVRNRVWQPTIELAKDDTSNHDGVETRRARDKNNPTRNTVTNGPDAQGSNGKPSRGRPSTIKRTLDLVREHGPLTISQLHGIAGLSEVQLGRQLRKLKQEGLVKWSSRGWELTPE